MSEKYAAMFRRLRSRDSYWKSYLVSSFTDALWRIMKKSGTSPADLARVLEVSPSYISKALRGSENFSVETMVKLASAVGAVVHVHVAKKDVHVEWREIPAEDEMLPLQVQHAAKEDMTPAPAQYAALVYTQSNDKPLAVH